MKIAMSMVMAFAAATLMADEVVQKEEVKCEGGVCSLECKGKAKEAKKEGAKLDDAARKAARAKRMEAREKAEAEKKGISVEELRKQRLANDAKLLGKSIEDVSKMTYEERIAARREAFKKLRAEKGGDKPAKPRKKGRKANADTAEADK